MEYLQSLLMANAGFMKPIISWTLLIRPLIIPLQRLKDAFMTECWLLQQKRLSFCCGLDTCDGTVKRPQSRDNNVMHAKPGLRVVFKWMLAGSACPDSVIDAVLPLEA